MITRSPSRRFIILALALAMSPALASANPHLGPARASIDELDYGKARTSLERALQWGKNQPAQVREIHGLLGEVHAALGQSKQAEAHFRRLLALDPEAELPAGSSPKIARPFAAAKKQMGGRSLRARCDIDMSGGRARVDVESDPETQVAGARVVLRGRDGAARPLEGRGKDAITVTLGKAAGVDMCALIDEHGNLLVELEIEGVAATSEPDSGPDSGPGGGRDTRLDTGLDTGAGPEKRSFLVRWPLWGALTVAAAGAGTYFALEARSDQAELDRLNQSSSEHDFAAAREVEKRGQRNALIANVSFGVAGACVVVTAVTILTRPSPGREARRTAVITPVPLQSGGAISAVFSF